MRMRARVGVRGMVRVGMRARGPASRSQKKAARELEANWWKSRQCFLLTWNTPRILPTFKRCPNSNFDGVDENRKPFRAGFR